MAVLSGTIMATRFKVLLSKLLPFNRGSPGPEIGAWGSWIILDTEIVTMSNRVSMIQYLTVIYIITNQLGRLSMTRCNMLNTLFGWGVQTAASNSWWDLLTAGHAGFKGNIVFSHQTWAFHADIPWNPTWQIQGIQTFACLWRLGG